MRVIKPELQLQHLTKRFGDLTVIDDLSLDVAKGELCCLLGPSGCGKTTTLKIIAGFWEPNEGAVCLAGREITHLPPQKRDVGMVFQNYALFPHLTVFENVAYGLRRRRWAEKEIKSKVADMLHLVQLEGYGGRRIHQLSGGQQQRIALARALVIEPKLLLLDEPLSNLDARLRADMRDEIRRIQRTLNITAVYVTHDQEEALSLADRIVVMNDGVIEQIGPPQEIYQRPATPFVADFIGRVNLLRGKINGGELQLLGKRFPSPAGRWAEGEEIICALRPEQIRLAPPETLSAKAIVKDSAYFGSMVRYRVTAAGIELQVEAPTPQALFRPGEVVELRWEFEDLHLFTGDQIVNTEHLSLGG